MRTKALVVLAVPLIALVGTTAASLVLQNYERNERAVALRAFNLITASDQILADALNAETGVRGYAVTGDATFLAPYNATSRRIGADQKTLRIAASVLGDVRQQRMVSGTVAKVMGLLERLRLAVSRGASHKSLASSLAAGKASMDLLREQVAAMNSGPGALLVDRRDATTRLENAIGRLDVAGLVLGLIAGLVGMVLFISGISRRVDAAAANADRLGAGELLRPVPAASDELGKLACSLIRAEQLLATRASDLTSARDEALQATQAKNTFLSSTSHELRTPLNSILGFAQLLEMSDFEPEDSDAVQRILGAGRHLLALINELIDIARIESGDLSLSLESVALIPLIEEAVSLMAPLAADRNVRIVNECACPVLTAHADRQRFSQVLVNLISNAVKYNTIGGSITITCCEVDAGRASVTVTDTGRGIAAQDLDLIFTPFERLGAERTSVEGTGIGLPLAQALTEAMNGTLSVSSVIGEGSAFTVMLPRAPDLTAEQAVARPSASPPPLPPQPRSLTSIRVLYIEDNPANVEVVSRFLRSRARTQLWSSPSGRAGIDYAVKNHPDLILLDLHLQDVHGDEVLNDLKANPVTASIPVVVLSADATHGMIKRLLAGGALAYLTKPLDLIELGNILDTFTSAPSGARDNEDV